MQWGDQPAVWDAIQEKVDELEINPERRLDSIGTMIAGKDARKCMNDLKSLVLDIPPGYEIQKWGGRLRQERHLVCGTHGVGGTV